MEFWDLYDEKERPLHKTHLRGEELPEGAFHYVVSISTFNDKNELLLTKRHPLKKWGLYWEITAGSVLSKEDLREAALRELKEETGITLKENQIIEFQRYKEENAIWVYYMAFTDCKKEELVMQEGETIDAVFLKEEELKEWMKEEKIAPTIIRRIHLTWDSLEPYFKEEEDHIIPYHPKYLKDILDICKDSIVSISDDLYSVAQKEAWSSSFVESDAWEKRLSHQFTYLIENHHRIKAMISATKEGEIDLLYVDSKEQKKGYARKLLECLEQQLKKERYFTYASKAAVPFFEKMGYHILKENEVIRKGEVLKNYVMERK